MNSISSIDLSAAIASQREFFQAGHTISLESRLKALRSLKNAVYQYENRILEALYADMKKPRIEAWTSEWTMVRDEIEFAIRNVKHWIKPRRAPSPLYQWPAQSFTKSTPYGTCLIIAPWNYPFNLAIIPLIGALAAGNTVVLKPSEFAPHTSNLISKMLKEAFSPSLVHVIEGDAQISQQLTESNFDHIFFTGGTGIGKKIMAVASNRLTPITLELGGKSPCVVDESANLKVTARRIVWGKFFNAGQTCVAPDYIVAEKSICDSLAEEMKSVVSEFYGRDPKQSKDYARLINTRHFDRIQSLLNTSKGEVFVGGESSREELYFAPTVVKLKDREDSLMKEEIFGPLLPVLSYENENELFSILRTHSHPLAFYLFSRDARLEQKLLSLIPFGGGCINDTLIHLGNPHLGFGGVGPSGIGRYHGKTSFECFSHQKSIVRRSFFADFPLRYPPFKPIKEFAIRLLMRI